MLYNGLATVVNFPRNARLPDFFAEVKIPLYSSMSYIELFDGNPGVAVSVSHYAL